MPNERRSTDNPYDLVRHNRFFVEIYSTHLRRDRVWQGVFCIYFRVYSACVGGVFHFLKPPVLTFDPCDPPVGGPTNMTGGALPFSMPLLRSFVDKSSPGTDGPLPDTLAPTGLPPLLRLLRAVNVPLLRAVDIAALLRAVPGATQCADWALTSPNLSPPPPPPPPSPPPPVFPSSTDFR